VSACGLAIVAIVVLAVMLSENVVYFRTVSEAVTQRTSTGSARFRMAGKVVPDTLVETVHGVRFALSDGKKTATVAFTGDPPSLFKAGAPVVCEGHWSGSAFASDRILIRHGSDYTPPKVDLKKS
jgi:cytochrome c-type biogenesis protein CcmE